MSVKNQRWRKRKKKFSVESITNEYVKLFSKIDSSENLSEENKRKIKLSLIEITTIILESKLEK